MENQERDQAQKKVWVCVCSPQVDFMRLGTYQCQNCKRSVVVFSADEEDMMPKISDYLFCPYCGK